MQSSTLKYAEVLVDKARRTEGINLRTELAGTLALHR